MTAPGPTIPRETIEKQALASDPRNSAWVSANAGSGKTHVLAQRVVRLLLEGTDPSKILCLTYTRAAAANMANRVFRDLAAWSVMDDARLADEIARLGGGRPDASRLRQARRLFARALETPGGLKIQTIHAFCEAILHQFPLEANIAGHFELLDGAMEEALVAEARRDLLAGAASEEDDRLSAAFADVLQRGGEAGLDRLLVEIVAKREGLRGFIDEIGNDATPFAVLFEEFGFAGDETAASIASAVWPLPGFPADYFDAFVASAEACEAKTVLNKMVPEATAGFAEADPERRLTHLANGFLTGKGEPYGDGSFKKALRDRLPDLLDRYTQAVRVILEVSDRLALLRMLEATRAALVIADHLLARYERLKHARGFLDFNDLIARTVRLLARPDAGPWVQYKLDRGIDHILIDEAQDTSPDQWQIVGRLAEEFFAGSGSRDNVHRTVFAVGDEKQSIYSFQGADPAAFHDTGAMFQQKVPAAGGSFERVRLLHSFRSTDDVLSAVDRVFAREEFRQGLTLDPETSEHKAIRAGAPGYVESWSSLGPEAVEEPDDWTEAIDHASAPAARLAETIAETIEDWIARGETIEGKGRRLTPGDVMVLVRKRDRFVHALSRSLKNRNIDVAGADRLRLTAHIAVQDLVALGRFLVQPHDDLSLAAALKSPLFDVSEETLFSLAHPRDRRTSLFEALRERAASDPVLAAVRDTLETWRNEAAFKPVFEFFAGVLSGTLNRKGARARMVARLGREAGDVLDVFLSFCLASEKTGLAGLEAFLATLDASAPEIKREMDQTRDEVRIMTVHAAKGLEAPVVFLVDPGSAPVIKQHLPLLMPFEPQGDGWRGTGYLWRAGKEVVNSAARKLEQHAEQKTEEEYRRLLYVGMTRAEDRLVVCGYHGVRGPSGQTWHSMVHDALTGAGETEELDRPDACKPVHRFRVTPLHAVTPAAEATAATPSHAPLPDDLAAPLPVAPAVPRPLSPSGASALIEADREPTVSTRSPVFDVEGRPNAAIERGRVVHRLLQTLPDLAMEDREPAARRYLARVCIDWSDAERETTWRSVAGVLEDPAFAPIFRPGSRAEVSVMGTLGLGNRQHVVSGKIDRLIVAEQEILIVDYKTNRPPPVGLEEVPPAYVAQLALYAELLKPLYPHRVIRAALVFTEAPRLIAVPEAAMQDELARIAHA